MDPKKDNIATFETVSRIDVNEDEGNSAHKGTEFVQSFDDRATETLVNMVGKDVVAWTSEDLLGMTFDSIYKAEAFYKAYTTKIGFGIRKCNQEYDRAGGIVLLRRWVCCRHGERAAKYIRNTERKREPRPLTRCSCKAAFAVRYQKCSGVYRVMTFNPEHNHTVANSKQVHFFRSNRDIREGQGVEIMTMKCAGIKISQIMDYMVTTLGGFENVGFIAKDLYNFVTADHERTRSLGTDAETTIAYLNALAGNDPGLYIRYAVDDDNKLNRLFWADSRSREDYNNFGDVLVIDSTYRTNAFRLPLIEFVGINNHYSTIVFGCALISEETIEAYTWVFRMLMHSMAEKQPTSILTDGDKAIQNAIGTIMPQARHRLCSWHLMRNARSVSPDENFLRDFRKCLLNQYSEEHFAAQWSMFVNKYKLTGNEWINEMYEKNERWAATYFKGIFFAGMATSSICESMHAYMNHFLNNDLSLYKFVKQFNRAVNRLRQNELQLDFVNSQSVPQLITHVHSLEKSAADFYSRNIFIKVRGEIQEELKFIPRIVKTDDEFTHVVIVEYGDESGREIHVMILKADGCMSCTCGMFESQWWPCQHMFYAMKSVGMKVIPEIMMKKRWAKKSNLHATTNDVDNASSVPHLEETRFGSLHARMYQLCHIVSKSEELYRLSLTEIDNMISRALSSAERYSDNPNGKQRCTVNNHDNVIRDPEIVRTKGSSQPNMTGKKCRKRHCGKCRKTCHNRSNCPNTKDEICGIKSDGNNLDIPQASLNDEENLVY